MPFFGGGGDYKIVGTNIDGGNDVLPVSTGDYNIGLGNGALQGATTGAENVALGQSALNLLTTGSQNVAVGAYAGDPISVGSSGNVLLGYSVFTLSAADATDNIVIGNSAGFSADTGNVQIGAYSGANSISNYNVIIGYQAGNGMDANGVEIPENNVIIGKDACANGFTSAIQESVIVGYKSGRNLYGDGTNGVGVISIGAYSCGGSASSADSRIVDGIFVGQSAFASLASFANSQMNANNVLIFGHDSGQFTPNAASTFTYSDVIALGNNINLGGFANATNRVIIGNDIVSASDNQIVIGDVSHTSILIGGVDFSAIGGVVNGTFTARVYTPEYFAAGVDNVAPTVNGAAYAGKFVAHADADTEFNVGACFAGTTAAVGARHFAWRSRGTLAAPAIVSNGDYLWQQYACGFDGTDYATAGWIGFNVNGTPGNDDMPGQFNIYVSPDGTQVPIQGVIVNTTAGALAGAPAMQIGSGSTTSQGWIFGTVASAQSGIWPTSVVPSATNYVELYTTNSYYRNAPTNHIFQIASNHKVEIRNTFLGLTSNLFLGFSSSTSNPASIDTCIYRETAGLLQINNGAANDYRDLKVRKHYVDQTVTPGGTTGNQTINKAAGTVNFAAAATTLTVTNNLVTANSTIFCTIRTNDATAQILNVVPAAGSFTINLAAAATAETSVGFLVIN